MNIARFGFVLPLALFGCSVQSADSTAGQVEQAAELAPPSCAAVAQEYSYFVAARNGRSGTYRISQLNSVPTRCADGWLSSSCNATLDLTPLNVNDADATKLLSQIGQDPRFATLIFVGKTVTTPGTWRTPATQSLTVYEIWKAPETRYLWGTAFHVSHGATRALKLNGWEEKDVKLDLADAPTMPDCDPDPNTGEEVCVETTAGVMEDAVAPAGLLAFGQRESNGNLWTWQYFLKIDFGQQALPNGYWYCRADQVVCPDSTCWSPEQGCGTHPHAHGRGFLYTRTPDPVVQPWLFTTTQLLDSDRPATYLKPQYCQ